MGFEIHEIDGDIRSAYGLTVADMNGDGKPDVIAGSMGSKMIAWYEGPTFEKHVVSTDHVGTICVAAHDITGSGRPDLIAGSGFSRSDRSITEYLHWLEASEEDGNWTSHLIDEIPYCHRLGMVDVHQDGDPVLVVAAIRGVDGTIEEWHDPGDIWLYEIPDEPYGKWPCHKIGHACLNHGFSAGDVDDDGRMDLLIGSRDGLLWLEPPAEDLTDPWIRHVISDLESSETWTADLDGDGINEILSIEPWHGNELAWYKCIGGDLRHGPWERHLIDDTLNRGHSVQCVDIDGDGKMEIISGYNGEGKTLNLYRATDDSYETWEREAVDPGGLGMGQMEILDLNGDGRLDIVATGMSSNNVRWYEAGSDH